MEENIVEIIYISGAGYFQLFSPRHPMWATKIEPSVSWSIFTQKFVFYMGEIYTYTKIYWGNNCGNSSYHLS